MKILSIDTSSNICSVAILQDKKIIYEKNIDNQLTHSQKLMPMIQECMDNASISIRDIDIFACSKGPGSFTGIRIGIATITAFVDVFKKPAFGITSLEGLAYNVKNEGLICSLIDAKNDNVYCGLFKLDNNQYTLLQDYTSDHIDNIFQTLFMYKNEKITFVGDGAVLHRNKLSSYFNNSLFCSNNKASAKSIGLAAFDKLILRRIWRTYLPISSLFKKISS